MAHNGRLSGEWGGGGKGGFNPSVSVCLLVYKAGTYCFNLIHRTWPHCSELGKGYRALFIRGAAPNQSHWIHLI